MAELMYWLKLGLNVITAGCSAFSTVMLFGFWLKSKKCWKEPVGRAEISK